MMSPLVIFDLDDTLVDTHSSVLAARRAAIDRAFPGEDVVTLGRALAHWARLAWYFQPDDLRHILMGIAAELGSPAPSHDVVQDASLLYEAEEIQRTVLLPGALAALDTLLDAGVTLALLCNGPADKQRRKIERVELGRLIDDQQLLIVADGTCCAPKPSPEGVIRLRRTAGASCESTVLVGDRPSDIVAGSLARVKTLLVYRNSLAVGLPGPACDAVALERPWRGVATLSDAVALLMAELLK